MKNEIAAMHTIPAASPSKAVDEVDRVDRRYHDQDGQHHGFVLGQAEQPIVRLGEIGEPRAAGEQDRGRADLADQVADRADPPAIVDDPDDHDQPAAAEKADDEASAVEGVAERDEVAADEQPGRDPDVHSDAAHPRGRRGMDIAVPRGNHGAELDGCQTHQRGHQIGDRYHDKQG